MQRKDTDEQCDACQNSGQLLYLGHYTKGEHEEDSDCMYCNHCRAYCANACLATIKGNSQDSYRKLRTSNVTQNHDKGMTTDDISAYMTPFIFNYETIYQLAKQNTNMLAGFNNHGYIIYGAEKNTPAGDINNGMIYTWEPGWGDMETYGISVILYCFR